MTPKQYYRDNDRDTVRQMAQRAGTSAENFRQIAMHGGACSRKLAKELERASGRMMTRDEILFPEDYEEDPAA